MNRLLLFGLPALAAAYACWVLRPKLHNLEHLASLSKQAEEHLRDCKQKAANHDTNGWISPLFDGFWDESTSCASTKLTRELVAGWGRIYSIHADPEILEEPTEPDARDKARSEFSRFLPGLHLELRKPVFLARDVGYQTSKLSTDFVATKDLVLALSAEAEALSREGNSEDAFECLRSILALSRGYRAFALMIRMLVSSSFINVACQTILHIYSPRDSGPTLSKLSSLILEALPDRAERILSLKCELAFGNEIYASVRRGELPLDYLAEFGKKLPLWKRLPGQVGRDQRIYQRDFSELLARMENGRSTGDLTSEVSQRFERYLRSLNVWTDFYRTVALVCGRLGDGNSGERNQPGFFWDQALPPAASYRDGQVVFTIDHQDLEIDILSSSWVENRDREIIFCPRPS